MAGTAGPTDASESPTRAVGGLVGVAGAIAALFVLRSVAVPVAASPNPAVNAELGYQLASLAVALTLVGVLWMVTPQSVRRYAGLGDLAAPVVPVPAIRLTPDADETWRSVGATFTVVITAVTTLVLVTTQFAGRTLGADLLAVVPWIVGFAAVNAFVEETVFRFGVVVWLADRLSPSTVALASGGIFGGVHYFGVAPNGLAGLVMAGFVGWFLAKSVLETGGLFWAWTIHFAQDLVIFTALFATVG